MSISARKGRERAAREHRIVEAARSIAESEGWGAVTIRRLAIEIEYSQPVRRPRGFRDLTKVLTQAAKGVTQCRDALGKVAKAYLAFAREHPAVYEAIFALPTGLQFAEADSKPELTAAFMALAAVVAPTGDDEVATETIWAAVHGLADLDRSGRIRRSACDARVALVIGGLLHIG